MNLFSSAFQCDSIHQYLIQFFPCLLFLLQFIREYTGKVDDLVKDKIEAQNEVKAKENEEKEVVAQQVITMASYCCPTFAV